MSAIAIFWEGLPKWVRDLAVGVGIALAIWFLGNAYVEARKAEAVRRDREKQRAKTLETVRKIEKESVGDADKAIEARDSVPRVDHADGVPDAVAGRIFRD